MYVCMYVYGHAITVNVHACPSVSLCGRTFRVRVSFCNHIRLYYIKIYSLSSGRLNLAPNQACNFPFKIASKAGRWNLPSSVPSFASLPPSVHSTVLLSVSIYLMHVCAVLITMSVQVFVSMCEFVCAHVCTCMCALSLWLPSTASFFFVFKCECMCACVRSLFVTFSFF